MRCTRTAYTRHLHALSPIRGWTAIPLWQHCGECRQLARRHWHLCLPQASAHRHAPTTCPAPCEPWRKALSLRPARTLHHRAARKNTLDGQQPNAQRGQGGQRLHPHLQPQRGEHTAHWRSHLHRPRGGGCSQRHGDSPPIPQR